MIEYRLTGAVARITLNRPEKRNAINERMIEELAHSLSLTALNKAVRVVVIGAAGEDFCAGMDIAALRESSGADVLKHRESARSLAGLFRALRAHPQPVIAAVRGRAFGGGCGIATACDVVLAAESAQFGYPEVKVGFVPAMVMSLLRRSVGEKRAFDLLAVGDPIGARAARDIGMITRMYHDEEFDAKVEQYVGALAERSASAITLTKKLLHHIDSMPFDAALDAGIEINAIARMTEDARRGFERFMKK
ncbi:MAG: enoyl-CoA hydratase/isomerase family protein [Bryobacterales bacterium]|nr:enoyl-CoA hydratase/isomerase family protein [Bryobacterales bacterium]MBV9396517.1 enoyl-CoA hydratase/isomerase family protein [Bryobacterales bacterium]